MSWITKFATSSIGQKIVMSLTGLFLISFLVIHLIGNLQLMIPDQGKQFNLYADFMTTNPVIKITSYLLYAAILWHAIQGIILWLNNKGARKSRYAVANKSTSTYSSRNMAWFGIIILTFIILHLYQFWLQMKLGALNTVEYAEADHAIKNLYEPVYAAFKNPIYVVIYLVSMVVIALHLHHGFQSAFQTLGINHKKYTPLIKTLGLAISVLIPLGFAVIPIYVYVAM